MLALKFFNNIPCVQKILQVPSMLSKLTTGNIHTSSVCMNDNWVNWRMRRDVRRRKMVEDYNPYRIQFIAMKRNKILPQIIKNDVEAHLSALPMDSWPLRAHGRCVLTSRSRGKVVPWRLSRIAFRDLADYNKLSGVIRAKW